MISDGKRKTGRPPKDETARVTMSLAMRIRPELYEEIRKLAEENGRSISAQAERRLLLQENDVSRLVGAAVERARDRAKKHGIIAPDAIEEECRRAAHIAVEIAYDRIAGPAESEIDEFVAAGRIDEANRRMSLDFTSADEAEFEAKGTLIPK